MHVEMINGMIKNGFNASGNPNITGSIIEKIAAGIERIANFFRNLTFENQQWPNCACPDMQIIKTCSPNMF